MNRLKGFRKLAGMSQAKLAEKIGTTTQAHISEYERGTRKLKNMPALQFVRLMTVLDAKPSLLLEDDVELPHVDQRDECREAEFEVAYLRRQYADHPNDDTLERLFKAEKRLGWKTREWEEEARRATFRSDPRQWRRP